MTDAMRRRLISTLASGAGLGLGASFVSDWQAANATTPRESLLTVTDYGALGDGRSDDTGAFQRAISDASGASVYVPSGSYVIDNLRVTDKANLVLDHGATMLARAPSPTNRMIQFSGSELTISGGAVDGLRGQQVNWPYIVMGDVPSGARISFTGVKFKSTVASVLRASLFGGVIEYLSCTFHDQAQHSGTRGRSSTILTVVSGETNAHGLVRFNHNSAIWTGVPREPGSNPGGIFVNTQKPGTEHNGEGNFTTVEAIGNYFYGYGQNCAGNDISPLHTYPTTYGMRAIGNYFEACGFCAISAKAVRDFICSGNVIRNGMYSVRHKATEGAISYVPGYHANGLPSPRAVITDNIIVDPGGESESELQRGIRVSGSGDTYADQVEVRGNILSGCGYGISVNLASNISIESNRIIQDLQSQAGATMGIRVDNSRGRISIRGNSIEMAGGTAVSAIRGVSGANVQFLDNVVSGTTNGTYSVAFRGVASLSCEGNNIQADRSMFVGGVGQVGTRHLAWGPSNRLSGSKWLDFAAIDSVSGHLIGSESPKGLVVPESAGVWYTQTNGGDSGHDTWISQGASSDSWRRLAVAE